MSGEQARETGDGFARVDNPVVSALPMEVQHTLKSGKPVTTEPGRIGIGVVIMPSGQPRIMVEMRHPDGTTLTAWVPTRTALQELGNMLVAADGEAQTILRGLAGETRQ